MTCASCLLLSEVGELMSFADGGGAHVPLAMANRTAVVPQSLGFVHRLRPDVGDRCSKTVEMRVGDAEAEASGDDDGGGVERRTGVTHEADGQHDYGEDDVRVRDHVCDRSRQDALLHWSRLSV